MEKSLSKNIHLIHLRIAFDLLLLESNKKCCLFGLRPPSAFDVCLWPAVSSLLHCAAILFDTHLGVVIYPVMILFRLLLMLIRVMLMKFLAVHISSVFVVLMGLRYVSRKIHSSWDVLPTQTFTQESVTHRHHKKTYGFFLLETSSFLSIPRTYL